MQLRKYKRRDERGEDESDGAFSAQSRGAMQAMSRKFLDAEYDCTSRNFRIDPNRDIARRSQKPTDEGPCSAL